MGESAFALDRFREIDAFIIVEGRQRRMKIRDALLSPAMACLAPRRTPQQCAASMFGLGQALADIINVAATSAGHSQTEREELAKLGMEAFARRHLENLLTPERLREIIGESHGSTAAKSAEPSAVSVLRQHGRAASRGLKTNAHPGASETARRGGS